MTWGAWFTHMNISEPITSSAPFYFISYIYIYIYINFLTFFFNQTLL